LPTEDLTRDLTLTEREQLARSIAVPLVFSIVTSVLGAFTLSWQGGSDATSGFLDLMQSLSLTLLAVAVLVLSKERFNGIVETAVILCLATFLLNLSKLLADATEKARESLYNALLSPLGVTIPNGFDPLAEFFFWVVAYLAIMGITWLAFRQTLVEYLAGGEEARIGDRIKKMVFNPKLAL
jgi:hypothetical protein